MSSPRSLPRGGAPSAPGCYNVARRGRVYSFEEYAAMLAEAGISPARRLDNAPWLQAECGA